jgi:adenylate kinase
MNIVILGPVGSGKTTQARLLADYLGVPLLNAGDLLFYASQSDDPKYTDIRDKMKKGELVDSNIMHSILADHLEQAEHKNGTLLDGHPRTVEEAKELDKIWPVDKVIYLHIDDQEVVKRLLARGREDDKPEVIEKRMEIFHQETEPVLEYYRQKGILEEIDGAKDIEDVQSDVQRKFI